jgi:flagellar motor switch protein FliG
MKSSTLKPVAAGPLSSAQKAAIVLASLPRETAAAIVAEVGDVHLKAFVRAVSEMKSVPAQARLAIAQEFIAAVLRRKEELPGGPTEAQRILAEITDAARVERVLGENGGPKRDAFAFWRKAGDLPAERLLNYLREQRPPAVAAVLLNLPAEKAAEVISLAPDEFRKKAIMTVARLKTPDPETSEAIAVAVEQELLRSPGAAEAATASEPATAILDLLPAALRDGLMTHLEAADAPIAAALRRALMTFEQLPDRLNEAAVAALFRSADRNTLMLALKHGDHNAPAAVSFLLSNISKRMADQFREDLDALPAPSIAEGESAQRKVVAVLKQLEKSGEIKIKPTT